MTNLKLLEKDISKDYAGAVCIPLEDSVARIFPSSQVRVRDVKDKEYYEILPQDIPYMSEATYRESKLQTKVNPKSLENQKLEIGDVVLSARNKLTSAEIITEELLSYGIVVVKNGSLIVRTGDVAIAATVKNYLQNKKVKKYVDDLSAPQERGKVRTIRVDVISQLPFPILKEKSLTTFKEYREKLDATGFIIEQLEKKMQILLTEQKHYACRKGLENIDNYDIQTWDLIGSKFNERLEQLDSIKIKMEVGEI